jgi:hypothetical protein
LVGMVSYLTRGAGHDDSPVLFWWLFLKKE